eukprot:15462179-Alexandrium_andersonii.AAC.2
MRDQRDKCAEWADRALGAFCNTPRWCEQRVFKGAPQWPCTSMHARPTARTHDGASVGRTTGTPWQAPHEAGPRVRHRPIQLAQHTRHKVHDMRCA